MFILGVYLFFRDTTPEYWLTALPLLLIAVFMSTLAEIKDQGHRVHVKRVWRSIEVPKEDVAGFAPSLLEGVGVMRLRRFVFPWGRIYYVTDWSKFGVVSSAAEKGSTGVAVKPHSSAHAVLESLVVASSGFLAARALRAGVHDSRLETFAMRIGAMTLAGALFVVFAVARTRGPSFANIVLFVATFIGGVSLG